MSADLNDKIVDELIQSHVKHEIHTMCSNKVGEFEKFGITTKKRLYHNCIEKSIHFLDVLNKAPRFDKEIKQQLKEYTMKMI